MGLFSVRVATVHCIAVRQLVMEVPRQKFGLATRLRKIPASVISSTCTRFLKFAWVYGVVVSMFDIHRSDRGSNPGRGDKIS